MSKKQNTGEVKVLRLELTAVIGILQAMTERIEKLQARVDERGRQPPPQEHLQRG